MTRPWYSGLAPCAVEVNCGDARHTVRWHKGRVVLMDHDLAAERALVALGGDACPCLELLSAWRFGLNEPDVLRWLCCVAIRPSPEGLAFMAQVLTGTFGPLATRGGWFAYTPPAAGGTAGAGATGSARARQRRAAAALQERLRQHELRRVLASMPRQWLHRMATAAAVHRLRRPGETATNPPVLPDEEIELHEVLADCAVPAVEANMRRWRGPRAMRQRFAVDCQAFDGAGPPSLDGCIDDRGGWALATLPHRWLVDVWARDAALIDDCFVLSAQPIDGVTLAVEVVRWERDGSGRSRPVIAGGTAKRTGDHWRMVGG